jgi:hypothetical protein
MKTWLLCEAGAHTEQKAGSPRKVLLKKYNECAKACFALATALAGNKPEVGVLVLNCLLCCRQCALECEKYPNEEDIQFCGIVSHICADSLKDMATEVSIFSLN